MTATPTGIGRTGLTPADVPVPTGLVLKPFRALRFDREVTGDLASVLAPPYDVIDARTQADLEARNPYNAVHLVLPRDEGDAVDSRYAVASRRLLAWQDDGALRRDPVAALYVYEETEPGGHRQRGLLGAVGLARADAGIVLPHENTMAGPVADRLALLSATATDLEPIFLVYDGGGEASGIVAAAADQDPLMDTVTEDGIRHRLTAITDPDALTVIAADLLPRVATIADGHHRYATYLRHQEDRHAAGAGNGPWDYGLAMLVDASVSGPAVHAIHRAIPSLPFEVAVARAAAGFRVRELPTVTETSGPDAGLSAALGELTATGGDGPAFLITDGSRVVLLDHPDPRALAEAIPADRGSAWRALDVTVAHRLLIDRLWEMPHHEDPDQEEVVGFQHDIPAAVAAVRPSGGTALLLRPTPVEAVADVARSGDRMPRKSTLFTPKPRSGVVLRPHD